jgi:hypothetical protein
MHDGNDCNATEGLGTIMRLRDCYWFAQCSVILMRLLHVVADTALEAYKSSGWGFQSTHVQNPFILISRPSHLLIEFEFPTARP